MALVFLNQTKIVRYRHYENDILSESQIYDDHEYSVFPFSCGYKSERIRIRSFLYTFDKLDTCMWVLHETKFRSSRRESQFPQIPCLFSVQQ